MISSTNCGRHITERITGKPRHYGQPAQRADRRLTGVVRMAIAARATCAVRRASILRLGIVTGGVIIAGRGVVAVLGAVLFR